MEGLKGLSLLLLVSLGVLLMVVAGAEDAEGATITVPDDYPTIQSAIDNATDYDTLLINDGLYIETVVVYRPLSIRGESQAGTIIQNDDPFAMLIAANRVNLSNVTVQGTTVGAGLILQASNCVIEDVTVRHSLWGLWVNRAYHNVVRNVQCLNNSWQGVLVEEADETLLQDVTSKGNNEGINIRSAVDTTLEDCTLMENRVHGLLVQRLVGFYETEDVAVRNCIISQNGGSGIEVLDTDGVTVEGCTVEDNSWSFVRLGVGFVGDWTTGGCVIEDNIIEDVGTSWSMVIVNGVDDCLIRNNLVSGRSGAIVVYSANNTLVSDNELVSTNDNGSIHTRGIIVGRHRNGVGLPPTNVALLRNDLSNFSEGIWIRGGWDIDVIDCTFADCSVGIAFTVFDYGDDPIIGGNVKGNTLDGCGLVIEGMQDVEVEGNVIKGADVGMYFNATSHMIKDNVFLGNTIRDCTEVGLSFAGTNGTSRFQWNNLLNNAEHSSAPIVGYTFDDTMKGNYWDDYEERYPDANIIGRVWDTPYTVGMSSIMDNYPLAYEFDTLPPIADAGEDQIVLAGTIVTLDGSGSVDNSVIPRYTWSFTYAGTPVTLEGETTSFPFLLIGSYLVMLKVEDVWGDTGQSVVSIEVYDDETPVADAGEDIEVGMGKVLFLNGSASTDNGLIETWEWHVDPEGLDRVLKGEVILFTLDEPGDYSVVLRVFDEAGNWDIDDIIVHVLDTEAPVSDAGRDFTADQDMVVTLNGRWSRDNVAVVSWTWTFTEDGEVMIEVGPTVDREFPFPGVYTIMLNVSDEAGNWDVDELVLTVRDTEAPLADAGEDITMIMGSLVTLDGTGSTDNVGVVGINWLFAEGSLVKSLLGAEASYRFDIPGEYELELQVWDEAGNIGLDWVIVTITDVPINARWYLGPFQDGDGKLGGVRVEVTLNGSSYSGYTEDDGNVLFIVAVEDLVSPASVVAEKEGWKTLEFTVELNANGEAVGTIPDMDRKVGGDGDDDDDEDDEIEWMAWGLVIVLIIAYAGTLVYLSGAAKRAKGE
jgi:parallel beta-helix repeat protein